MPADAGLRLLPHSEGSWTPASASDDDSWALLSSLLQVLAAEQLSDLDGVQCGALAQTVGHAPQGEPVVDGRILAHAADVGRIFADAFDRSHVSAILALIDEHDAGRFAQDFLGFGRANLILELDMHGLAVADE